MLESTSHGVVVVTFLTNSDCSSWLCKRVAVDTLALPVNGQQLSWQKGIMVVILQQRKSHLLQPLVPTQLTSDQAAGRVRVDGT
jgi:hypothetical protein